MSSNILSSKIRTEWWKRLCGLATLFSMSNELCADGHVSRAWCQNNIPACWETLTTKSCCAGRSEAELGTGAQYRKEIQTTVREQTHLRAGDTDEAVLRPGGS